MEFVVFTGVLLFIFLFMIVQELMQAKKRGKNIPELSLGKLRKRTAEGIFAGEICKA